MSDIRTTTDQPAGQTTIIERRSGGGSGTVLLAIVLLFAVVIGGWYLFSVAPAQNAKDRAISGAADSVSRTADKVGSAVDSSTK
jgi:hypothetical protein